MIQLNFYAQPIPQETFIYTVMILFAWALAVKRSSTSFYSLWYISEKESAWAIYDKSEWQLC